MIEHDPIDTGLWRAGCSATGTSGSEGGPRKRTDSKDRQRASARPYDLEAGAKNGFEAEIEAIFDEGYHGIRFAFTEVRYSTEENFSGTVAYSHDHGEGAFELQISYRQSLILPTVDLHIAQAHYHSRVECGTPVLHGLDPYEMIAEKLMATSRRMGGSGKDVYDLDLWASKPFDEALVRRLAVLKAWTDRRHDPRYNPEELLAAIVPASFRWTDLKGLVPREQTDKPAEQQRICNAVRTRFAGLAYLSPDEQTLLADQTSHRHPKLFEKLAAQAVEMRHELP